LPCSFFNSPPPPLAPIFLLRYSQKSFFALNLILLKKLTCMKEEKKDCWPWGYILDIKFDEPYYLQSAGGITQTLRLDNRFVYFQYTDFYYNQQPCSSLHERNSLSIHMEAVRLAGKPTKKTYGRYRIWASPIIRPSRCYHDAFWLQFVRHFLYNTNSLRTLKGCRWDYIQADIL
jgi:hypothetical protein